MPRFHDLKPSFNAGELSPVLASRTDFVKYPSGVEEMQNIIALAEGGAMRRSGSRYIAEVADSTIKNVLRRFEFSQDQAYILELGEGTLRFFRNQALITVAATDAAITNGTFDSDISGWTDVSTGTGAISHDATNLIMILTSAAAGNEGIAEQSVTTTSTSVEHVLKFQVIGRTGLSLTVRVGSATGLSDYLTDFEAKIGYHALAFTPTASPFFVQFENANANKAVGLDNVSLLDDEALSLQTPWTEAVIPLVNGPQSADVLYFFTETVITHKLERRGNTTWSLVHADWIDGPYFDVNETTTTLTPSAVTGNGITITASSITGINGGEGFLSTDPDRLIRIDNPATGVDWGYAIIVDITSTTIVTADVKRDFPAITADVNWALGAWSSTTGYPKTGSFFQQRLYSAGSSDQPQTFWASQTGDFENMTPDSDPTTVGLFDGTVEDDDALNYTLSADNVNAIQWLKATRNVLSIGTAGGEWVPESTGIVITPLDIAVNRQTTHGSATGVEPVTVDNVILFLQRAERKIQEFAFSFDSDGFEAADMSRLARHITFGGITDMSFAEEPDSILWSVRSDGVLLSMTFRRQEDVVGWARHILGGRFAGGVNVATASDVSFTAPDTISSAASEFTDFEAGDEILISGTTAGTNDGSFIIDTAEDDEIVTIEQTLTTQAAGATVSITEYTDAVVESVETIPGTDGAGQTQDSTSRDEVWIIVKRTINALTVRFVEVFERSFEIGHDQEDAYYCDSMLTYDSTSTTSITGLDHLEGETVKTWGDGAIIPDEVVSSGAITIDSAVSVAQVGLPYSHKLKTLKIEGGNAAGTSIGKTKRIYALTFVLLNAHTLNYGPDEDTTATDDFRVVLDPMDAGAPFFTGEKTVKFEGPWRTDTRIIIESDDPSPFTVLALAPEIAVNALI